MATRWQTAHSFTWFVFCCGLILVDFTQINQGYFIGAGKIHSANGAALMIMGKNS